MKKVATFIVLLIFLALSFSKAQDVSGIQKMLGASNTGKEYWLTVPPCYEDESGGFNNFIKLFVISDINTRVTVEVPGKGFYQTRNIIANNTTEINLNPEIAQVIRKAGSDNTPPEQIYAASGIHVYSDDPIIVYCVVRYHWTSDGFLAIPVSSLGTEYFVSCVKVDPMMRAVWNYKLPTTCGIVASFDDTKVRITLGGNDNTKTSGGKKPGDTWQVVLNTGDVYMFATDTDNGDLTGSKIESSKPVAVVTGNMCANIPTGNQWCDYVAEMDLPVHLWGYTYLVPKIPGRKFPAELKILASEPNTTIYKDGYFYSTIELAGGVEGKAFLTTRLFDSVDINSPVVLTADKPIVVTLGNTGAQEEGTTNTHADPFTMAITPVEQFPHEIAFCTPGILGGAGFAENFILLNYQMDENNQMPDDLMIAGPISGDTLVWTSIRTSYPSVDIPYKYEINGVKFAQKSILLPSDGVYAIRGNLSFGAYSVGFSDYDTYGYPTGTYMRDMTKPDNDKPVPAYTKSGDGKVTDGSVSDYPEDQDVRTNLSMIVYHNDKSSNYQFKYDNFVPGQTRSTKWNLEPIDSKKNAKAVITFADRRGNDTTIEISYTYSVLYLAPTPTNFGVPVVGQIVTKTFKLVNWSANNKIIDKIELKKGNVGFSVNTAGIQFPVMLQPNDSLNFTITFDPIDTASVSDSIGVTDDGSFSYLGRVEAGSPAPIMYTPGKIDYGLVNPGEKSVIQVNIENTGGEDLVINRCMGPFSGYFSTDFDFFTSSPLIIPPNTSKIYNIAFNSKAGKAFINDSIVFIINTQKGYEVLRLSGQTGSPVIQVSDIDCGTIYSLDQITKKITITNQGSAELTVFGCNITGNSGITLLEQNPPSTSSPWVIPILQSKDISIGIKPTGYGAMQGTITFLSDATGVKNYSGVSANFVTGVKENKVILENTVTVFPNPASGKISISSSVAPSNIIYVEIFGVDGKIADSYTVNSNADVINENGMFTSTYNTSGLPDGNYFVRVSSGNTTRTGKFTVSR